MVRAWYMDTKDDDQRLPHTTEVLSLVSPNQLKQLGVETWKITVGPEEKNFSTPELERIRAERNYVNYDIITIHPEKLPNYEEKVRNFFNEHLHVDEEIRFVLDGSGYFDVRDRNEKWIRIEVLPGDLLVLPAGIYHRFTTDTKNFAKAMRLFKEEPVWTPYNRGSEADKMAARQAYVERFYNSPVPLVPSVEHKKTVGVNGEGFVLTSAAQAKANYPHLRRVNGMLYVSGASSRRFDNTFRGATPNGDGTFTLDVAEQTRGVIENIRACLNAAGADLEHLVDVTCFLTDMKLYADFNKAYNEYFNLESGPTRTTVAVKELPGPLIQVEIKAVAVDPHFQR